MSRVDDDRDAARIAAKQMEARRAEESRKTNKAKENNAFSQMVSKGKAESMQKLAQVAEQQNTAKSAIAMLLEQADGPTSGAAMQKQHASTSQEAASFKGRLGSKEVDTRVHDDSRATGHKGERAKVQSDQGTAQQSTAQSADQGASARRTDARTADAKRGGESLSERGEASDSTAAGRAGSASKEKGGLKADADKGGGAKQDNKDKGGSGGAMSQGFRFNPALMAPMSVAKPKEASGSERLRKVANELAQKIVENVRVGTNALGRTEFQIDLRGNVLGGLSVKISSHQGKIKAVFSGASKDVLKMIEEHGEELKKALSERGLTLEDFKVEART